MLYTNLYINNMLELAHLRHINIYKDNLMFPKLLLFFTFSCSVSEIVHYFMNGLITLLDELLLEEMTAVRELAGWKE